MTERYQVYKCSVCGNITQVLHGAGGRMKCCGEDMTLLVEQTADSTKEKHVPVVQKVPGGVKVVVGSVPHPMLEAHYVEWIEVIAGDAVYRQHLKPGQAPEAFFAVEASSLVAREFCNIHGLWRS